MNTDGSGFRVVYNFTAVTSATNADGAGPVSAILSSNTLFGVTHAGGAGGAGTVFSLFLPPPLALSLLGTNVVLTWPTNAEGFTLHSTTTLTTPPVWSPVSTLPVVVDGQNVLTNLATEPQQYYRLAR